MSVQAWFSGDEISVDPGDTVGLSLTVHNTGEADESYTIVPAGVTASWMRLETTLLEVAGGEQGSILVDVTPPRLPSTTAGPTSVALRVIPSAEPVEDVVADTTLLVERFDERAITPLQPVQRARRRATYEFMVENHGNALASCRLLLHDPSGRVDGSFDPPAVGIPPGGANLVQLRARAQGGFLRGATRTLEFEIEAQQQGKPPASAALSMVQPPTVSGATVSRWLAVLALLAAAVLAWVAVVDPAIEDAADRAVDERLTSTSSVAVPTTEAEDTVVTTSVAGDVSDDEDSSQGATDPDAMEGEPTFFRLSVSAPLTQTVDDTQTIPEGQLFDMTDVRVENPFNDSGLATLLVNGEAIFVWSLQNVRGQLFEPRITQLRLQPGDNVTFAVRCDEISDAIRPTCSNAINIGGTAIAVDEV